MTSLILLIAIFTGIVFLIGLVTVLSATKMDKNNFPTKNDNSVYWQKRGSKTNYSSIGIDDSDDWP